MAVKHAILEDKYADQAWFDEVESEVKKTVDQSVKLQRSLNIQNRKKFTKMSMCNRSYPFVMD